MVDHISKPLNVQVMFATIRRWMAHGRRQKLPAVTPAATPAAPSSQGQGPDYAQLPGVDAQAGLATTLNNPTLYRKMLSKFLAGQAGFVAAFEQAEHDADPNAQARLAHTLKGNAGNIGAKGVQAAAAALEEACMKGLPQEQIKRLLDPVRVALDTVIEGLTAWQASATAVAAQDAVVAGPAVAPAEVAGELKRLRQLLEDSDFDAVDCIADLIALLKGAPPAAELQPLAQMIEAYEFDEALKALARVSG